MRIQRFTMVSDENEPILKPENDGELVRYEDVKHMLHGKPKNKPKSAKLSSGVKLFNEKLKEALDNAAEKRV